MMKGLTWPSESKILAVSFKVDLLVISTVLVYSLSCVKLKENISMEGSILLQEFWRFELVMTGHLILLQLLHTSNSIIMIAKLVGCILLTKVVKDLST